MVAITAATLNIHVAASAAAKVPEDEGTEKHDSTVQVDLSGLKANDQAKSTQSSQESNEPPHIKQLREMIRQLQKQLAEEQKQLAELMQRDMDETLKLAAVTGKQASIATLSGEIQAAMALLLEALSKSGGSSAGGMVSAKA
ncbi:hypothetical protein [Pseudomonas guariconensis]|uniref:hypothetical protein n=1 Tax=Pseudomonas guariconensis TaxID=1288410 RepID=UPI0018AA9018|nr:hypothetical protein [Pseudomonas guariconensis]MBF8742598.1 hypothetical protein [Pseudomonas guariconensis]MBF8751674.1 hypothetical protein [Pseudomonas guariconensis]